SDLGSILWEQRQGAKGDAVANVLRTFSITPFAPRQDPRRAGARRSVARGVRNKPDDEELLRRRSIGRAGPAGDSGGGARGGRRLEGGTRARPATLAAFRRGRHGRAQGLHRSRS